MKYEQNSRSYYFRLSVFQFVSFVRLHLIDVTDPRSICLNDFKRWTRRAPLDSCDAIKKRLAGEDLADSNRGAFHMDCMLN